MGTTRADVKIALDLGAGGWLGGRYYLRNLALAIRGLPTAEQPELVGLDVRGDADELDDVVARIDVLPSDVDVVFPNWSLRGRTAAAQIHWIPDLQHRSLPHNFSIGERVRREVGYRRFAARARSIVVSSEAVRNQAARAFPLASRKLRVLHFTTVVEPAFLAADPLETLRRYGISNDFALVANQFWRHKNHAVVFDALRELNLPVVCTGSTEDYRHPRYFAELMERVAAAGRPAQVVVLGVVPRSDYVQLVRAARVVIQPSLFEGWSSIVEDARAFGKPLVLSDIPVHREQSPEMAVYFEPRDPDALVRAMESVLELAVLPPADALEAQRERAMRYGRAFVELAREAADDRPRIPSRSNRR